MDEKSSSSTTTTTESNSKIDSSNEEAEESNDGDYETEEEEERRRRRRRRSHKRPQRQTLEQSNFDKDEMVKLCRLVKMYHVQQEQNSAEGVSPKVSIYRVDPKVLVNLLEEISIAFGVKTNHWLKGLEKYTMNIWGSFATNGLVNFIRFFQMYINFYV